MKSIKLTALATITLDCELDEQQTATVLGEMSKKNLDPNDEYEIAKTVLTLERIGRLFPFLHSKELDCAPQSIVALQLNEAT